MSDPKDQNIVKLVNSEIVKCKCKNCKKKNLNTLLRTILFCEMFRFTLNRLIM